MIRASVSPYAAGRAGLVVVDDAAAPIRVLLARAFDVGELAPNPNAAREKDHAFVRVIEAHHVADVVERVVATLREHRVQALAIEAPRGSGANAGRVQVIGNALEAAAGAIGVAVDRAPVAGPVPELTPWPPADDVRAVRQAAGLLRLASTGGDYGSCERDGAIRAEVVAGREIHRPGTRRPRENSSVARRVAPLPATTIAAYDLGSAHLGAVIVGGALPLDVVDAHTLGVDPDNLDAVVAVAVELAVRGGCTRAAIEYGAKFYVPDSASKQQIMSMAAAHAICGQLQRRLSDALTAAGIETQTWARQSWAHRVVQHKQGSITTAAANDALRALCGDEWAKLRDQHQRDAVGVACMWLVEPPPPPKRPTRPAKRDPNAVAKPVLTPEQKLERRRTQWREYDRAHPREGRPPDASAGERAKLGCTCTHKHRIGCPVHESRVSAKEKRVADAVAKGPYLRPDTFR